MEKKSDRLKKRREQLSAQIVNTEQREKTRERKIRTRRLIQQGGLIDIAGLDKLDPGALLGGLLYLSAVIDDSKNAKTIKRWKTNGDNVLEARQKKTKRPRRKNHESS